jgi:hypothetical protein
VKEAFVGNASDPKQVKAAKSKEVSKRDQELDDVIHVLSSVQGRRFLWRVLGLCHVFKTSFTGNSTTFFNEGKRDIGLRILGDINEASPESYLAMMQESKKESERV